MLGREKESEGRLIIYATDVHGNGSFIEKMLEEAEKHRVKAVILNGDITPDEYFLDIIGQRSFFEQYMTPLFAKFRKRNPDTEIFVIMGNHDFSVNMDVFYDAGKKGIFNALHDRVYSIAGYAIVGYSYINPAGTFDWEKPEAELKKDLEKLAKKIRDFRRMIFVSHAPPFNTKLDMRYGNYHVGSKSIREFISKYQPYLGLHGHIHESPNLTGSITDKIGKTLCVNPGNAKAILIDIETLEIKKL